MPGRTYCPRTERGFTCSMIHTDVYYGRPVVYKLTTSLRDQYITLDSWMHPVNYKQTNKDVVNTYLRPVSFVSNDAAVYPD